MTFALSIQQPWVELILRQRKTVEVRTWPTKHRGELWLHAGVKVNKPMLRNFGITTKEITVGALVGNCELYDCVEFTAETWKSLLDHHLNVGAFKKGQYAWLLRNAKRVPAKPMKGRLGLMKLEMPQECAP